MILKFIHWIPLIKHSQNSMEPASCRPCRGDHSAPTFHTFTGCQLKPEVS